MSPSWAYHKYFWYRESFSGQSGCKQMILSCSALLKKEQNFEHIQLAFYARTIPGWFNELLGNDQGLLPNRHLMSLLHCTWFTQSPVVECALAADCSCLLRRDFDAYAVVSVGYVDKQPQVLCLCRGGGIVIFLTAPWLGPVLDSSNVSRAIW